jgi:4-hydroxy-3-polyprenylbenzoate decarboxylase
LLAGAEVHCVVSTYGQRLLFDELGVKRIELDELCPNLAGEADHRRRFVAHPNKDVGAVIASGSFLHDGMAVLPCSSTSLGAIATGSGSNLLTRAAMVTLKERRPLIVCHRETPLSLIDIENMRTLTLAGAIICPTNPGFYLHPRRVQDIVDFIAGKVLDLLGVEHALKTRWEDAAPTSPAQSPAE